MARERETYSVRLQAEGHERFVAVLQTVGAKGDAAFGRIETAASEANRSLNRLVAMGRTVQHALTAMAGVLAVRELVSWGQSALAAANALQDQADVLGISTEALQTYRFALQSVGVTQQQADTGLQRFTRRLGEAAQGSGVLKDILEDYGIAIRNADGTTRRAEDVLRDYADAMRNAESQEERLRLAVAAFDTEGVRFVNLLKEGRDGLQRMADEARSCSPAAWTA